MIKKLILFLVRKKLGVKNYETFRFTNQKSDYDFYYFERNGLIKYERRDSHGEFKPAGVSLNWLLSDDCEIRKI